LNPALEEHVLTDQLAAVDRAFSKQSQHYDEDDRMNPILRDMRHQVYVHVKKYLKQNGSILELNAGTGIDAAHFASLGHRVHATDLSTGMIKQIINKGHSPALQGRLTCQQLSYDQLHQLNVGKFDYIFSNFGGLNCIKDLSSVTMHLTHLLNPGGIVTFVIMPPLSLWELAWILKGNGRQALRRINKNGIKAHLEGEFFNTYYHSLADIKKAFGPKFELLSSEGLCSLSPPPSAKEFVSNHPHLYKFLRSVDALIRQIFPFNRWADHIIATFKAME
jgi:2-polyprenyl-3-methyl-5-hydroxy-6-metoxy-1,4-benzoquinol methylase